jgi:hypothetical protein
MRKCPRLRSRVLLDRVLLDIVLCIALAASLSARAGDALVSSAVVERAKTDVERIQVLVDQGTLPQSRLDEALARLGDAEDDAILSATLYNAASLQDMTPAQAAAMLAAAQRRVDRETTLVADRQKLLDLGIIAKSEMAGVNAELTSRQSALNLARSRLKLLDELRQMAAQEQNLERAAQASMLKDGLKYSMTRYDGSGVFNLAEINEISTEFEKHFHRPLPITANGQTALHQALGLDHRNRVDVGLNPDQPEGIWLRQLLERLHVPYLAFTSAVAGAATAPHIHIGTASTRLKLAGR